MRQQSRASRIQNLRTWVEQNLVLLCRRAGEGLQGKLRQRESNEERTWYTFVHRTTFTEDEKMQIRALDELVSQSAAQANAASSSHSEVPLPSADAGTGHAAADVSMPKDEFHSAAEDNDQLRHLRGNSVQTIVRGGATHLKPETLRSWFDLFGYAYSDNRDVNVESMVAIQQRLQECIWFVDLLACGNGPDGDNWLHGGCVDHASCPHCRSLWSGIAPASLFVENDDNNGDVSFSLFVADRGEPVILDNPRIRLTLNAHIREPTTMHWRDQSREFEDAAHSCELRLFCISRSSGQVLWHADTRRAFYQETERVFAAGAHASLRRTISVDMYATCDADGLGCKFNCVDLVGYREIHKGFDGW